MPYNDIDFYALYLSNGPPPNDDLDLQIVWLSAVERFGRQVNASILAEYWLSYVTPNWVEYGTGKANLTAGFPPPLSGHLGNRYGTSCGCTAATLRAILGIIKDASALPEKWTAPLDGKIVTMCINRTSGGVWVPKTVSELTDRILRVTPRFLDVEYCDILAQGGYSISCFEIDTADYRAGKRDLIVDIALQGRHTSTPIKVTLMHSMDIERGFRAFTALHGVYPLKQPRIGSFGG